MDRSAEVLGEVKRRMRRYVTARAIEIHRADVAAWAGSDDGDFPTRIDALRQAQFEAETLFRALGEWAAVRPDQIPATKPSRRGRFDRAEWRWELP